MPVFEMSFSREGFSFRRTIRSCVKGVLRARSSRAPHRISGKPAGYPHPWHGTRGGCDGTCARTLHQRRYESRPSCRRFLVGLGSKVEHALDKTVFAVSIVCLTI